MKVTTTLQFVRETKAFYLYEDPDKTSIPNIYIRKEFLSTRPSHIRVTVEEGGPEDDA